MSRLLESDAIDDEKLATCDVPDPQDSRCPLRTQRSRGHRAVRRARRRGPLVGDHTDYEGSSSHMNSITQHFGFTLRHDLLFSVGEPYFEPFVHAAVPHPVVQEVPPMEFAVSCSIDPGYSLGQAVIRGKGLWDLPPEYRYENWHPEPEYRPDMRTGPSSRPGPRPTARAGSWPGPTRRSSPASACSAGKSELFFGAINWLNRHSPLDRPWPRWGLALAAWLASLGLVVAGWRWGRGD